MTPEEGAGVVTDVMERVESAAVVDRPVLESVVAAVLARGHVLLEDVPGTGKTVTARILAESLGLSFTRIQFTPDLLPSDVTGSNIYNEHDGEFEFSEGPVFTNVLLADEINRAPPKTQAALLEAMEERQVSADGTTHDLPEPFFVIATQNPIEQGGTFRLPEAQRDRFSVKTSLGYPDVDGEMGLLERRANRRSLAPSVDAVTERTTVLEVQELAEDITVETRVRRYIVDLARETRQDARTEIGVSPRGVQRVFEAARARAVIEGQDFVTPEDVKQLAQPTMAHRVVLTTEATVDGVEGYDVVADALTRVDVPGVSPDDEDGPGRGSTERQTPGDQRGQQPRDTGQGGSRSRQSRDTQQRGDRRNQQQGNQRRGGDTRGSQPRDSPDRQQSPSGDLRPRTQHPDGSWTGPDDQSGRGRSGPDTHGRGPADPDTSPEHYPDEDRRGQGDGPNRGEPDGQRADGERTDDEP